MPRTVAKRLLERLERIAEDPFAPQISVKPLVGRAGVFRVRQGDLGGIASPAMRCGAYWTMRSQ